MDERDRIGKYEVIIEQCTGPNRNKKYVMESWYNEDGEPHRLGDPATIVKDLQGNVVRSEYYRNGLLHREDGPALTASDGQSQTEEWYFNGHLNRFKGGPAKTVTHLESGIVTDEVWAVMGVEDRRDGPAVISRSSQTGVATQEQWKWNGRTHRSKGPAHIERSASTGRVRTECWYSEGKLHNISGPAVIHYSPMDGSIIRTSYYQAGELLSPGAAPGMTL